VSVEASILAMIVAGSDAGCRLPSATPGNVDVAINPV
jgi:hypothetical protein